MVCTLAAEGPFGPSCASYWTFAPSSSDLKPLPLIDEWCTNRSLPWSSGVMKPKPLSSLNHFTVPVAIGVWPSGGYVHCETRRVLTQQLRTLGTAMTGVLTGPDESSLAGGRGWWRVEHV